MLALTDFTSKPGLFLDGLLKLLLLLFLGKCLAFNSQSRLLLLVIDFAVEFVELIEDLKEGDAPGKDRVVLIFADNGTCGLETALLAKEEIEVSAHVIVLHLQGTILG